MRLFFTLACTSAIALLLTAGALAAEPKSSSGLEVGDAAPQFELKTDEGKPWKSAEHYKDKIVVVYFYPAAMTGGCTKQACAYRDDLAKLGDKNVEVVAVSGDFVPALALFKKAEKLNFPLLSDPEGEVAKKFGVPTREGGKIQRTVDGKEHTLERGVTSARWTFVIKDGKVAMKNNKVNAAGDSKAVLSFVEKNTK